MTIFQKIKNAISKMQLKFAMILRGQPYTHTQTSLAYNIKKADKQSFSLKIHEYPELSQFILGFLNSAAINGKILGQNLAFVVGAGGIGKTTLVENALDSFRTIKLDKKGWNGQVDVHKWMSPQGYEWQQRKKQFDNQHFILINKNYQEEPALNFEGFINNLQEKMINQLLKLNKKIGEKVLDPIIIRDILLSQNAEQYLFVYLKDVIYSIINGCDPLFLNDVNTLKQLNEQIIKIEAYQFFYGQLYQQLISLLSQSLQISQTQICIRLFVSIGKRIQYEHRSDVFVDSWFTSGLQSTDILFDLMNFVCGFGKLNRNIMEKYFQDWNMPPSSSNWVLSGNRADVCLCLLNLQQLYIWDSPELWNFLDHVIARTAVANGLRNHFPVILELPSAADIEDIQSVGQFELGSVPFIQVPGYVHHTYLKSSIAKVLPQKILTKLYYSLGKSPAVWTDALKELSQGASFKDLIDSKAEFIKKDGIRAQAMFNRIFTSPEAQEAISNGSAIPELIQYMRLFRKARGMMSVDRPGYYADFISRPLFQALMRQGLVYHNFYLPQYEMSRLSYFPNLMKLKNKLLKKHWKQFILWRIKNRKRFSIYGPQTKQKAKWQQEYIKYDKYMTPRQEYHLGESYYGGLYNYQHRYALKGVQQKLA